MNQVTNTLWPYDGRAPWSCPRCEAVLHRSTKHTEQSGFGAPAPLSPRAAGMFTPRKQQPRGSKRESKKSHFKTNLGLNSSPEITSPVPMKHLASATGTKGSNSSTREQVTNQANEASLEHTTGGKMTQQENLIHCQIYHLSTCSHRAACCRESQEQAHSVLKPSGRGWMNFFSLGLDYKNFQNRFTMS